MSISIWNYSFQLKHVMVVISGNFFFIYKNIQYIELLRKRIYFHVLGTLVTNGTQIPFHQLFVK